MALAPLLYNITFDSQTRILYFLDKAGHEIYHCEIPSPAPALPTVSRIGNYAVTPHTSMNLSPQQISPWLFTVSSYIDQSTYPNSTFAARRGWTGSGGSTVNGSNLSCIWDDTDGGAGIYQVTRLSVKNISSSNITLYTVDIYECSSLSATVITVYDSSNNPYNAFKYTLYGTDYYYVLDGIQTNWTDDLESIGYHLTVPLPTVSDTMYLFNSSGGLGVGQINTLIDSNNNTVDYDTTACYACQNCMDSSGVAKNPTSLAIVNESGILKVTNISDNYISVYYVRTKKCYSNLATVITVYDSSNTPYNAFKYTSDGTDYYYVLDGTQTDWTDDLSGIGYKLPMVGWFKTGGQSATTDESLSYRYWYPLYNASGGDYMIGDQSKTYKPLKAVKADGTEIDVSASYMQCIYYTGYMSIQFKPDISIEAHHLIFVEQ